MFKYAGRRQEPCAILDRSSVGNFCMTRTYAIPDIHGRLDLLELALERIAVHSSGGGDTIVALGDYVDRGPDSRRVIERLMGWKSERLALICLKGNHESMMWEVCNNLAELSWWLQNGGDATLASYGAEQSQITSAIPQLHLDWIGTLTPVYADAHRVYVHAAVDPALPLDKQNEQTTLWGRYPKGNLQGHGGRHVVHGHHANPAAPLVTKGRTNLDGMAWKTGRLVIGVYDDDRSGAADQYLEVRA
jgi:serine/threonine protein phosphatase 1